MDVIVIPTLQELACILLLARFWVQTSDTLALLQHHIKRLGVHSQVRGMGKSVDLN